MTRTTSFPRADELTRAAYRWWRMKRPIGYEQYHHLENPTINTATPSEKRLALAVANVLRGKGRRQRGISKATGRDYHGKGVKLS